MALNARELLLVLRARDEASRVLRSFSGNLSSLNSQAQRQAAQTAARGAALATVGASMMFAGAMAVGALNDMTNAAMAYNQETSKTLTQVDKAGVSFAQLKQMGIDVGNTVPAAFEQMQPALYDIFSSIDTNAPGARILLEGIAKAAVGGAVSMEEAGRSAITVLNAYKKPASDITHVNDVMFQLVRKGVGTYQQFTTTIGRAIPSAIKYGQSFETVAGAMAFMTRNGLSTAMSATSVARAMDALSNPKTVINFKKFGVELTDAKGKFRPLADVMTELRTKMSGMSEAARAAKLNELFKGSGGTIQAMRFFNHAVSDSNGLLNQMTSDMNHAGGAAAEAYKIMSNTPQAKLQLLNNKYQIMKTVVGDQLLPAKMKLAEAISKVLDWFLKLSPATQAWIVKAVALAAGLTILIGIVMSVVGVVLLFVAAAAAAGIGIGALIGIVAGVVAGIVGLVAVGILLYKNWDTIKAKAIEVWGSIVAKVQEVWAGLQGFRDNVSAFASEIWTYLQPIASKIWNDIKAGISSMVSTIQPYWDQFAAAISMVSAHAQEFASGAGHALGFLFDLLKPVIYAIIGALGILASIVGGVLRVAFEAIGGIIGNFIQILTGIITFIYSVFTGQWGAAWDALVSIFKGFVGIVVNLWNFLVGAIGSIVSNLVSGIIGFFKHLYDVLVGHSIIPDLVKAIISWIASLPGKVWSIISSLAAGFISRVSSMASTVKSNVSSFISGVVTYFAAMPGRILTSVSTLASKLYTWATGAMSRAKSGMVSGFSTISSYVSAIPGRILSLLGSLGNLLTGAGSSIMNGLHSGISAGWEKVKGLVSGMGPWIASHKGPRNYDLRLLRPAGQWIMSGLAGSLRDNLSLVRRELENTSNTIANGVSASFTDNRPPVDPGFGGGGYGGNGGSGYSGAPVQVTVHTEEINPVKHAADLGYEIARNLGE